MTAFDRFTAALQARGCRGNGRDFTCPAHDDHRASLRVTKAADRVLLRCFATCSTEDVVAALGLTMADLFDAPKEKPGKQIVATYPYTDENGTVLFEVVRFHPKDFRQRRPDGAWSLNGVRRVPYRLPELLAGVADGKPVYVVEGEKDVHAIEASGGVATCNPGGAGKWRAEFALFLRGAEVVVVADRDEPGRHHAQAVADSLRPVAASVQLVEPAAGKDTADHLAAGHGLEDFVPFEPVPSLSAAALFEDVLRFVRRFVVFGSDHQATATVLWVVHTWAIEAAEATAYLAVSSPVKRSGKTRLLEVLELLVPEAWLTGRTTAAVLVRKLAGEPPPTLLLDESDAAFSGDKDYAQALRAVLNLGHRRGGKASLCIGQGAGIKAADFPVFGAKAIAGLGRLPDTVEDRSIPVRLARRAPGEKVERFRWRDARAEAERLRVGLSSWAASSINTLRAARPIFPRGLSDRAEDGWEPLLAIADAAGGDWPARARGAAVFLHHDESGPGHSHRELLLRHAKETFEERGEDRLSTADLLAALVERDDGPWLEWWGQDVSAGNTKGPAARLARLLREFGVKPKKLKVGGAAVQGYEREAFEDAWTRYVPPPVPSSPPLVPSSNSELGTSQVRGYVDTEGSEHDTPSEQGGSEFRVQSRNQGEKDGTGPLDFASRLEVEAAIEELFGGQAHELMLAWPSRWPGTRRLPADHFRAFVAARQASRSGKR